MFPPFRSRLGIRSVCLAGVSSRVLACPSVWPQQRGHQPTPPIWQPHISGPHSPRPPYSDDRARAAHYYPGTWTGTGLPLVLLDTTTIPPQPPLTHPPLTIHHYHSQPHFVVVVVVVVVIDKQSIPPLSSPPPSSLLSSSPRSSRYRQPHLTSPLQLPHALRPPLICSGHRFLSPGMLQVREPLSLPSLTLLSASAPLYLSMSPSPAVAV